MSCQSPESIIKSVFGSVAPDRSEISFERFQLPLPKDADYQFWVDFQEGEPQVGAKLLVEPDVYLWYLPFDAYGYKDVDEMNEALKIVLKTIANHKTRIIQKRGILMQRFVLDYFDEGWKELDGISGFRLSNLKFPTIEQRRCLYYSPALLGNKGNSD